MNVRIYRMYGYEELLNIIHTQPNPTPPTPSSSNISPRACPWAPSPFQGKMYISTEANDRGRLGPAGRSRKATAIASLEGTTFTSE